MEKLEDVIINTEEIEIDPVFNRIIDALRKENYRSYTLTGRLFKTCNKITTIDYPKEVNYLEPVKQSENIVNVLWDEISYLRETNNLLNQVVTELSSLV